jgi:hypothetical protein
VHGVDDLSVIDPAQIDRRHPKIRMPELALDNRDRDPFARHLDRVGMPELMLVPTSAQPPLGRLDRYAEPGEKVRARCDVGGVDVGITRAVVVILS